MNNKIFKLVLAALFLALGLVLPMGFHTVGLGKAFLPMHIPVLLCGLVLGMEYGFLVGLLTPILSSVLTGMPAIPYAFVMMAELAAYGFFAGLAKRFVSKDYFGILIALILGMLLGRVVYGFAQWMFMIYNGNAYTLGAFLASAFVNSIAGIILQIIIIPPIVLAINSILKKHGYK